MLTYRPGDPVTIGELHVSKEANFTGSSISKLKLPEKRKVSKRPYSYIAAMESPNGAYTCVMPCVFYHIYLLYKAEKPSVCLSV